MTILSFFANKIGYRQYFETKQPNPITTKQYMSLAKRPKNTSISKKKITKEFGLHIRHWKTSLSNCMNNL